MSGEHSVVFDSDNLSPRSWVNIYPVHNLLLFSASCSNHDNQSVYDRSKSTELVGFSVKTL